MRKWSQVASEEVEIQYESFLIDSVVWCQNGLPSKVVKFPSLEIFKGQVDVAVKDMV